MSSGIRAWCLRPDGYILTPSLKAKTQKPSSSQVEAQSLKIRTEGVSYLQYKVQKTVSGSRRGDWEYLGLGY